MEVIINRSYDTESDLCTSDRDQYEDSDERHEDSDERRNNDYHENHNDKTSEDESSGNYKKPCSDSHGW